MKVARRHRIVLTALAGALGCAWPGHGAGAAPPLTRMATPRAPASETKAPVLVERLPPRRLDLAAPAMAAAPYERAAATLFAPGRQRGAAGASETSLPGLGTAAPARIMSRPEMLVRNFKREGLPLARLFQSENSLVHVGLSPKGKPGLWFVEKLH